MLRTHFKKTQPGPDSPSLRSLVLPRSAFLGVPFCALSTCVLSWIVFSHRDCLLPDLISVCSTTFSIKLQMDPQSVEVSLQSI